MGLQRQGWIWLGRISKWVGIIGATAAGSWGIAAAYAKQLPTPLPPNAEMIDKAASWMFPHTLWVVPIGALLGAGCPYLDRWARRQPLRRAHMERWLDRMRRFVFNEEVLGQPEQHHRLTVFRPKGKKLVIYARSSFSTRRSTRRFRFDPHEEERCEGFAGRACNQQVVLGEENLPDLHGIATPNDFADYARRSFVTVEWLNLNKPHARCYAAYPIRLHGEPWGVLVADSRDPYGVKASWQPANAYRSSEKDLISLFMQGIVEAGSI